MIGWPARCGGGGGGGGGDGRLAQMCGWITKMCGVGEKKENDDYDGKRKKNNPETVESTD